MIEIIFLLLFFSDSDAFPTDTSLPLEVAVKKYETTPCDPLVAPANTYINVANSDRSTEESKSNFGGGAGSSYVNVNIC